jgi:hypothetical protein
MELGESALFYPLGRAPLDMDIEGPNDDQLNIELEVQIDPYSGEEG